MVNLRPRRSSPKVRQQVRRPVPLVRDVVELLWEDRGQVFRGKLAKRLRMKDNVFLVRYDDGDELWHDLDEHYWRLSGKKEWVPPSIFRDEKPSLQVTGASERTQPKGKRKRPTCAQVTPRCVNESKHVLPSGETPRKRSKPNQLSRNLSKESLSNAKDDKVTKRSRVTKSSVLPQSEASTQLSSSKGSEDEATERHELPIPTVTADTHSTPILKPEETAVTQSHAGITTSSVGSVDLRVPPRKRNAFLSL